MVTISRGCFYICSIETLWSQLQEDASISVVLRLYGHNYKRMLLYLVVLRLYGHNCKNYLTTDQASPCCCTIADKLYVRSHHAIRIVLLHVNYYSACIQHKCSMWCHSNGGHHCETHYKHMKGMESNNRVALL